MRILWAGYPDDATADAEIDKLEDFYQLNYPDVSPRKARPDRRRRSTSSRSSTASPRRPEMKVTATTYPNNLGHQDFPGCFRCHDGGHFRW